MSFVGAQRDLLGQQGSNLGQQANLWGQQTQLAQIPFPQLQALASLVPGNAGTASSADVPANIAQAFQNQYQGQLNAYNTNVASENSTMRGLFGLGGAGMSAPAL
ncbi:hypothetical protein [Ralstonia solanacearum]|uniref:hypothetical protein n=1 Tax=Ralstonia solanacearum TaxID=305 RepID=UPI001E2E9487|nr:hypothetical protein [Ralstonia solanacearum]